LRDWLAFHTGAPLTVDPSAAEFAVVSKRGPWPDFEDLAPGTPSYPDRSTTLICDGVTFDEGGRVDLSGPGIAGTTTLCLSGVPQDIVARLSANRATFPLGIDVLLAGEAGIVGLPRSVRVTRG
jgi:alpha-D-ribose 1-methylphosphonate 5-triphosphate synthase subunit PhnH